MSKDIMEMVTDQMNNLGLDWTSHLKTQYIIDKQSCFARELDKLLCRSPPILILFILCSL